MTREYMVKVKDVNGLYRVFPRVLEDATQLAKTEGLPQAREYVVKHGTPTSMRSAASMLTL